MVTHKIKRLEDFLQLDIQEIEKELSEYTEDKWIKESKKEAIQLFKQASKRIPAYKDFLKNNSIDPDSIRTYEDFKHIPFTDKKNYIDKYPLHDLVWDGKLAKSLFINASSGSTGIPYYWPGAMDQVVQGSIIKEIIYKNNFQLDKKSTLMIICFGMGTWIAGQ